MRRVLAFDLGKRLGFGLLGGASVLSGSHDIVPRWSPLGASLLKLEDRLADLITAHQPQAIACATPFVRLDRDEDDPARKYNDTTQNLVPMFACYGALHMVAAAMGVLLKAVNEQDAREKFLGAGNVPSGSFKLKTAVQQECRNRGWPATDDHAADALCVASAAVELLDPELSYEVTPLFMAMPTVSARRGRKGRKRA